MVRECLYHAMGNCQGVPPRGAGNLDLLSSANCRRQVGMFVLDGISLRNIKLSAGEKFLKEVFPEPRLVINACGRRVNRLPTDCFGDANVLGRGFREVQAGLSGGREDVHRASHLGTDS